MLTTANPEINVEDLMRRIRQEVAQRKEALTSAPASPAARRNYTVGELLNLEEENFVRKAYVAILRREPDAPGLAHSLHILRTGQMSRAEILDILRGSPEGRACAAATLQTAAVPWTPYAQTAVALPRLPENADLVTSRSEYTLAELLNYDDDCFVRSAYLGVLRREPDASGHAYWLQMLRTDQLSKIEILGRIRFSPEGKACAVPVRGLLLPFVVQSAYRIPVLGYGVALANFLLRLPVIIRNRVSFEASTLRQQREQALQINALTAQIESAIGHVQQDFVNSGTRFDSLVQQNLALAGMIERLTSELSEKADTTFVQSLTRALAAQTNEQILGLNQAVQTKADRTQLEALAAQTDEQVLGLTQAVQTKAALAQVETLTAQTNEQILGLNQAVQTKADLTQLEVLAAQTDEQVLGLTQAVQTKAALAQVEALTAQTNEQILGLNQAVQIKADLTQLEALGAQTDAQVQGLTQAVQTKAALAQVESLTAQTNEQIHGLNQAVQTKADLTQLEALAAQTDEQVQGLTQAVQARAALAQVEALTAQTNEQILDLNQAVQTKADLTQVQALATQTGEQVFSLGKALEIKANNERLTQLTNHLIEIVQRKADATELSTTATRLGEELAQKADATVTQQETGDIHRQILGLNQAVQTKADLTQLEALAAQTDEQIQGLTQAVQTKAALAQVETLAAQTNEQILDHKRNILDQQRRLALLLEEARKRLPAPISTEQIEDMVAEEDHLLDAFYVSFEDRFRGTREDVKQRVAVYLPVVRDAKAGAKNAPILDIGCGRGEWLELLNDNHLVARGVDLNRVMVSQCQELGLEVAEAEAIAYLRKLKANSVGAVTGMHIIEHIPFKRLVALFDEVMRVLKPGGVAIFETPNPENLIVGACNFYYDPTHLNPLPPESMKFVMEARGFARIEIMRLHPHPEAAMLSQGAPEVQRIVNDLFRGAQDYSLVGYKS